jgi:hypothetical protein
MGLVMEEVIWMPREEAEDMVRNRRMHQIDKQTPVAIGLHPDDHSLACLLLELPSREPIPIWNGVRVYRLDSSDFD